MRKLKFIDLFAGLGGFHKALHELGHECVFASELDPNLRQLYKQNWNIEAHGDIKKIVKNEINLIPEHDVLCGGFPCQPFSKAGKQLGLKDENRGNLFDEIIKILEFRRPKYFILENVLFLAQHNNEETWNYMNSEFERIKYKVLHNKYSPHDFGIPQHRKRIFIVGSSEELDHFSFDNIDKEKKEVTDIHQFLETNPEDARKLSQKNIECLDIWQELIDAIPIETKIPGFPIWGMEFGATYPYEKSFPYQLTDNELGEWKGNFGISLKGLDREQQLKNLPSYARIESPFPDWKQDYIRQSRKFYEDNKKYIKEAVTKIAAYDSQSWQKLEWNVGNKERKIKNYIIQFRASGIRVKKVDYFPSLFCTSTQTPIIGWENRYITKNEGLKLQSLEGIILPDNDNMAFKALGNAVNSKIVKLIAEQLIQ